jgi:hypothetical protein
MAHTATDGYLVLYSLKPAIVLFFTTNSTTTFLSAMGNYSSQKLGGIPIAFFNEA